VPAKPTELKKLIALLDNEAPTVEWLAKEVWNLVEDLIFKREHYVAICHHGSLDLWQAVGPYPTRDKLMKDYQKRLSAIDDTAWGGIALLRRPDMIES
jgi:hypothetical protein